ncbi:MULTISPECIES: putative immunity protein [Erysipelothrix]|nr:MULTISPECIES: hypothetical protein [Erysipelothrix]
MDTISNTSNMTDTELLETLLKDTPKPIVVMWAGDCLEHALTLCRYRDVHATASLKATRDWVQGTMTTDEARKRALKAHERARELTKTEHIYLLRASGHAAGTTQVKAHGIQCADYALKAVQVGKRSKRSLERKWQLDTLTNYLDKKTS